MSIRKWFLIVFLVLPLLGLRSDCNIFGPDRDPFSVPVGNATFCEFSKTFIGDVEFTEPVPPQDVRTFTAELVPEEQFYYVRRRNRRDRVDVAVRVQAIDADGALVLSDQKIRRNAQAHVAHSVTFDEDDFNPPLSCPRG